MPEVSVVMPAFNCEAFIGVALRSVLAQDFDDFEVVVVDDGSTDGTAAVVSTIADPRIRYVYQENGGPASARNRALTMARASLIGFLDADDVWEPGFLARMVGYLHAHPDTDGVYCGYQYMRADGTPLPEVVNRVVPAEALYTALLEASFLNTCSMVVRHRCFERVAHFDITLRQAQDTDLWLRLARVFRIVGLSDVLVWYRQHCSNSTSDLDVKCRSLAEVVRKHFGDDDGSPEEWSLHKCLAYAGYYQTLASIRLRAGDLAGCAQSIARMLAIRPDWVDQERWCFSLIGANVPRDQMGESGALDFEESVTSVLDVLSRVFGAPDCGNLSALKARAYGNMYWALGTVAYWQRQIGASRLWYCRALRMRPALLLDFRRSHLMFRYGAGGIVRQLMEQARGCRETAVSAIQQHGLSV